MPHSFSSCSASPRSREDWIRHVIACAKPDSSTSSRKQDPRTGQRPRKSSSKSDRIGSDRALEAVFAEFVERSGELDVDWGRWRRVAMPSDRWRYVSGRLSLLREDIQTDEEKYVLQALATCAVSNLELWAGLAASGTKRSRNSDSSSSKGPRDEPDNREPAEKHVDRRQHPVGEVERARDQSQNHDGAELPESPQRISQPFDGRRLLAMRAVRIRR